MKLSQLVLLALAALLSVAAGAQSYHLEPNKVQGPEACAECHEKTTEIWKETHHARTFKELPRREEATEIASRLGVKRIKTAAECSGCHFTAMPVNDKVKAVAGVSCESCHGEGDGWIDIHSDFGGRDVQAEDETPEHKTERYRHSEAHGMIRPVNVEGLIRNCYSCHMIADEKLVNQGGHSTSSPFEIVRWSQGEVRHNVWYSDSNDEADPARKRHLFLVGQVLNYEYALRALATASHIGPFAKAVAKQANGAQKRLQRLSEMLNVAELDEAANIAGRTKLALNNSDALLASADRIAEIAGKLAKGYDGQAWDAIDPVLPKPAKYKGKAVQ